METPRRVAAALEAGTPGDWQLVFDARTGVLTSGRRGFAPGGPEASAAAVRTRAEAFRARHAALLGAHVAVLRCVRAERLGRAWHVTWQQWSADRLVEDALLDLTISSAGDVVAFRSTLVPGCATTGDAPDPASALARVAVALGRPVRLAAHRPVVVVRPAGDGWRAEDGTRLDVRSGYAEKWDALVVTSGELLALESRLREASLVGRAVAEVVPLYAHDEPLDRPLSSLHLELADRDPPARVTSDADGRFAFEVPGGVGLRLRAGLAGSWLAVTNDAGEAPARYEAWVDVPGSAAVRFADPGSRLDERNIYVHANFIHDEMARRFRFTGLDVPLPAVAGARNPLTGDPHYANAYWDGEGIHFGDGGDVFFNTGLFADVIFHEYTHGVTDRMYRPLGGLPGLQGAALHEALSDYFACTLTGEPRIGEYLLRDALVPHLRNLENNRHWPEDARYEAHSDGEVFGGAMWDLRRLVGPDIADPLVHFARSHGARTFENYVAAVLLEDDLQFGDGQADNGSPHRAAILSAFGAHGFGPAAALGRRLAHQPLRDVEDGGRSRTVVAGFQDGLSSSADTLYLHYSPGGPFVGVRMQRRPDGSFAAEIPAAVLGEGATLRYWIERIAQRRIAAQTHPPGAPDSTHHFHVGPDHTPPAIAHVAIPSAAALAWPVRVQASISDNLGVAAAWLETERNGAPEARVGLVRDPFDPERYEAEFPNVGGLGDAIAYRLVAIDAARAANRGVLPADGSFARFTIVRQLDEGFERGPGAWTHSSLRGGGADPWHWTANDNHTVGGSRSMWCGRPGGEYPPDVLAAMATESYRVGAGAWARVWSRLDAEPNGLVEAFDGGAVQIQVEGETGWGSIAPTSGYTHRLVTADAGPLLPAGSPCLSGRDAGWQALEFDLAPWAGRRVRLRFLFASDHIASPFALAGWRLDDFHLEPGVSDPTGTSETPAANGPALLAPPGPNPFRSEVHFALALPAAAGPLRLEVYDAAGRRVSRLVDGKLPPGRSGLTWDGTGPGGLALPSGVYYYRLQSRFGTERGRIVRLR